ncbi:MAG: helix-hairpin-helix domain-containing protein [Tannerella sp.]|jgi:DNA uptake protein ComE-like DNA-binding protein|nr:helix-hairpin-helix domain-containing protein [Tannerella sp.]
MSWRDYFYFSKGERSALIILLCLITIAGIVLVITDSNNAETPEIKPNISQIQQADSSGIICYEDTLVISKPKNVQKEKTQKKETVSERVKRLTSSQPGYTRTEKFTAGTVIELNSADTTTLKKVPGIGSAFANRIVKYRNLLGGFYSVSQLGEVYGIDEEKYNSLAPWFTVDILLIKQLNIHTLPQESLRKHPYINYQQAKAINKLLQQKKKLSGWENLQLLNEFTEHDKARLQHYLSFE